MRKRIGFWMRIGLVAIGAAMIAGCATTGQQGLALIGTVPNPSEPVLRNLCVKDCQANACTNYNTVMDACEHGLPIQGAVGVAMLAHFCPVNNYPYMGSLPMIVLPDSCVK